MKRKILKLIILSLAFLAVVFIVIYVINYTKEQAENKPPEGEKPKLAYNIHIDTLDIVRETVPANATLSTLLNDYVSAGIIDRIARESRDTFDVRRIRSGNSYARIITRDSLKRTLYFIYEINNIDYVVYDFRDTLRFFTGKKRVTKEEKVTSGIITSSLWNAFAERKLNQNLGLSLADVFAWTVDFYGLQEGDGFKIIYDEYRVDNAPIGSYHIKAALFRSSGKDFYAFDFAQKGKSDYFDEKGNSLRKAFLKAPLRFSRISSRFSNSRKHPILRISRPHHGVDYAAPKGTPVVALGDGKVLDVTWKGGYGRYISIRHNSVYTTTYAHLSGYAKGIKSGVHVTQGQIIGYVGSSGLSTGPHLDFRVYKNGSPIDPLKIESPSAEPVPAAMLPGFLKQAEKLHQRLDSIRL